MKHRDELLKAQLLDRGLRPTPARKLILGHLCERTDHPHAEAIREGLAKRGHRVGTATLYQNLNRLSAAGLLRRMAGSDGTMHFDANVAPHPHLVCRRCPAIVDVAVTVGSLDSLATTCPRTGHEFREDWSIEGLTLEFVGLCPACLKAGRV